MAKAPTMADKAASSDSIDVEVIKEAGGAGSADLETQKARGKLAPSKGVDPERAMQEFKSTTRQLYQLAANTANYSSLPLKVETILIALANQLSVIRSRG